MKCWRLWLSPKTVYKSVKNTPTETLLAQIVNQFAQRHRRLPKLVVVTPEALAALAVKNAVPTRVNGIPVVCRDIKRDEVTNGNDASMVCVTVVVSSDFSETSVRGCSLSG